MFNWLGNLFPYSDLHSLNLDWILTKMKETAAQAAKAIADSANALAQVIEAKTAAQNAQTAAQNAQTAASNAQTAANNAATSAENAAGVAQTAQSMAQNAQTAAQSAQNAAQNAQTTAQSAQTAAQTAQTKAETAQTAAETAQSAAETAQNGITTLNSKFPIKAEDIAPKAVTYQKLKMNRFSLTTVDANNGLVYLTPSTGSDVSQITDVLTDEGIPNFIRLLPGTYLQFQVDVFTGSISNRNNNITFDFPPAHYNKKANLPLCIPFLFRNDTSSTVTRGYAKFLHPDTNTYTFQMFFDDPPTFPENSIFRGSIRTVDAYNVF